MSLRAEIHAFSSWSSVKLSPVMTTDNILHSITQGNTMKIFLESVTGECPKRLGSLDGLTESQKVTRSEWFISALKNKEKIPPMLRVNLEMFAKGSKTHVLTVLWQLVCNDIKSMWKFSRVMQSNNDIIVLAEPFVLGPHTIYRSDEISLFHLDKDGMSITRKLKKKSTYSYSQYLKRMITSQLESTGEPGCQDIIQSWDDLLNNRIWCGLINSFLPGTFTTEVLLNDRWSINLALKVATKMFKINCLVDSEDLSQGDSSAISAFLTWFFLCGFQLRQAMAVVRRMTYLQEKITDLKKKYSAWQDSQDSTKLEVCDIIKRKELETSMESTEKEIDWLSRVYDIEACTIWKEEALEEQEKVRRVITQKMKDRFDIITLTRYLIFIDQPFKALVQSLYRPRQSDPDPLILYQSGIILHYMQF
ncbi:uncharacterized protein [Dysidea avara]|uniref:uncharacterized protein n=1 Tax=Dysidea avara TaxID=196820 RepID=UPI0033210A1E